jgi:hypothetical protein
MKIKSILVGVIVLAAGCGHDHPMQPPTMQTPPPPPPPSTNVSVTTSQLLTDYAQKPSETGTPVAVNGGAFTITDTSDTTAPLAVNGN